MGYQSIFWRLNLSKKKISLKTNEDITNSSEDENIKTNEKTTNFQSDADTESLSASVDDNIVDEISIEETVKKQNIEIKDLKDQLLRSLAEGENLRKRTIKEVGDAKKYSHLYFVRDLISSVDNFQRALEAVPDDKSQLSEPIKNLVIGLEIVEKEILNTFENHSLKQINPLGEKFDYNLHQAMFEVPTNEKDPGYVFEVSQKGYLLHDRLVRPAMVGISKKLEEETTDQNNKK